MDEILQSEDLRLLADIGFIATSRGFFEHAQAIFEALKVLRPEGEAGFLGDGMVAILGGDPASAVKTLQNAPKSDGISTFLGIALVQSGDANGGRQMLQDVCQTASGTPFAEIAKQTLETMDGAA